MSGKPTDMAVAHLQVLYRDAMEEHARLQQEAANARMDAARIEGHAERKAALATSYMEALLALGSSAETSVDA